MHAEPAATPQTDSLTDCVAFYGTDDWVQGRVKWRKDFFFWHKQPKSFLCLKDMAGNQTIITMLKLKLSQPMRLTGYILFVLALRRPLLPIERNQIMVCRCSELTRVVKLIFLCFCLLHCPKLIFQSSTQLIYLKQSGATEKEKKKEKHKKLDFVQTELQFSSFVFLYSRTTACFHLRVWFFFVQFCNMLCQSINGHPQEYYYGQSVKVLAAESVKSIYSHQFICFLVNHHMDGQVRTCAEEAAIQLSVPSPAALAAEGHSGSGWD